ncbi:hypothetical protein [Hymenobacter properus]|uniref:VWA domain-containing protein n=1 Tax=Hymenobacter properus TaxID=2791026 RepID=A0A931FL94_9BACT|nr:hypothetical protein [Hymenobacter properus]MBF9141811.1 hypothetical protein [Hymenobacter properus]MBR7720619.1 hypothetical protein [Microvirga sp. SRT04]
MKHVLLLLLLLTGLRGAAQPRVPAPRELEAFYDQCNAYQVRKYRPERGYELRTLRSNFSDEELAALRLGNLQLVRVDLVYTAFRLDPAFRQRQLNLGRLRNLTARLPGILTNPAISWNLVEQTGCSSSETCQDYFHGFVLYIEKRYTAADTKREADSLARTLDLRLRKFDRLRAARKSSGKPIACNYPPSRYSLKDLNKRLKQRYRTPPGLHGTFGFEARADQAGVVQQVLLHPADPGAAVPPELAAKLQETLAFASGFRVGKQRFPFVVRGEVVLPVRRRSLRFRGYYLADSLMRKHNIRLRSDDCVARFYKPGELRDDELLPNPDASVVSKVMARHPEWRKQVVVADVTGSMAPYTLDLLTWLQLSALQEEKTFVFFNDGNDAPDKTKTIGRTGGLYEVKTADFEQIKSKVLEAMLAGGGGDAPENDAEALLRAQQLEPAATEYIWLADNHTFPRDTELLKLGPGKVRIILCGAYGYVNPRYLALARTRGYTLHTLEGDITSLSTLLEGQTISIMGAQYLVTKDGFKLIKTL